MFLNVVVVLVIFLHCNFLILEMFLWTQPKGLKVFGHSLAHAKISAKLAANQGLYNGFLAAGLLWGLLASDLRQACEIKLFFLSCVVVAGVYGAWTVKPKIFFIQALPAIIGLFFLFVSQMP